MLRFLRPILALGALLTLANCATVTTGTSQDINVVTDPPGARCELSRDGGMIGLVDPAPGVAKVDKSTRAIVVTCRRSGFDDEVVVLTSDFQAMTIGNVLLGGIIGVAIDAGSGAMNRYPDSTMVMMVPTRFATAAERDTFFGRLVDSARSRAEGDLSAIRETAECKSGTNLGQCQQNIRKREEAREAELTRIEQRRQRARVG